MDRIFSKSMIKVSKKLKKRLESLHTMIFSNATYLLILKFIITLILSSLGVKLVAGWSSAKIKLHCTILNKVTKIPAL